MPNSVTLTVAEAFELGKRGRSTLTKKYMRENEGSYPVYSAATLGPAGFIDTFDFDGEYLSWSTNGYGGRTMLLAGKFSITSDRAVLVPKMERLDLEYCRIVLGPKFSEEARGRRAESGKKNEYTKLRPDEAMKVEFEVPCDEHGELDELAQADFVARWQKTSEFQRRANELAAILSKALVHPELDESYDVELVQITDDSAFEFIRKETGWFKKVWRQLDTGDEDDYPMYSAARAPIAHIGETLKKLIEASEEEPVLSFAVDGDGSAGSNFVVHRRPFYISTNRTALRAADASIDIEYVYFALQTMKADYGFNYNYKAYRAHLEDVVVSMPVGSSERFDKLEQQRVASRQRRLREIRTSTVDVLQNLAGASVTV